MKMTTKFIIASVVLPLAFSTGSALAFGEKNSKDDQCRVGLDRSIIEELELTKAQKEQFKTLHQSTKEERKNKKKGNPEENQAERLAGLESINALLIAEKFDLAKATEIVQEMAQKQIKREVSMLNDQYKMISILTPEQKNKFVALQEARLKNCVEEMPHGKNRK